VALGVGWCTTCLLACRHVHVCLAVCMCMIGMQFACYWSDAAGSNEGVQPPNESSIAPATTVLFLVSNMTLKGQCLTMFCTSGLAGSAPTRRLMEKTVFVALRLTWDFASSPISSLPSLKAT
jgi:hypothetical protein